MLLPQLSCNDTVTITMLAICGVSIIPEYITAVEAKLDQSQTGKLYLNCWNNLQRREHIDQRFNATKTPNYLDTDDVGICYDSARHQVQQ